MDVQLSTSKISYSEKDIGIVFRYSRANIYSYHALIGSLERDPHLANIPIFIPTPDSFFTEVNRLLLTERYKKLVVGLSLHTFQLDENIRVIHELNQHSNRDKISIVVGGPHPSAKPRDLLNEGANIVVVGEGEKTFPEVITKIINESSFASQKGIAFLNEQNKLIIQPPNDLINLDDYPPFAPAHELYSALEITRGCNYLCKYCQTPSLLGKKVRYRSPQEIIKWGKFLLSKRDNWDFRFITPNAFGYGSKKATIPNIPMIKELLSGLKNLKAKKRRRIFFGTFPSEVRPESITEDTLNLTKEYCDNDNITLGAQTGSPRIMKLIRRGHTIERVVEAVDLATSFGFKLNVDFIIGYPEETEEDQNLTIELCKQLIVKGCKVHMHYLIPLPGTEYAEVTPSPIAPDILKMLRKWSNDGTIFGSWQHQYDLITRNVKRN